MSWSDYVHAYIEPGERQVDVARRTGVDQTTISRWMHGEGAITSQAVAKFARAYDRPVLEAFVVAGFLTESEAGIKVSEVVDWSKVSDREFVAEMRRRLARIEGAGDDPAPLAINVRPIRKAEVSTSAPSG